MSYLAHISKIWSYILADLPSRYVDAYTVACLEGRSPKLARQDRVYLNEKIDAGEIFCWVSEIHRTKLRQKISSVFCIIPSLHTFLEDTKWLEPAAKAVRVILFKESRLTIRKQLSDYFVLEACRFRGVDQKIAFGKAYRTLFLLALLHWAELGEVNPRRDNKNSRAPPLRSKTESLQKLYKEAFQLGFHTPVVLDAQGVDCHRDLARAAILHVRPDLNSVAGDIAEAVIQEVAGSLRKLDTMDECQTQKGHISTNICQPFRLFYRCGRMYEHAYHSNQVLLHAQNVYPPQDDTFSREDITPFGVSANTFRAFFGNEFAAPARIDQEGVPLPTAGPDRSQNLLNSI